MAFSVLRNHSAYRPSDEQSRPVASGIRDVSNLAIVRLLHASSRNATVPVRQSARRHRRTVTRGVLQNHIGFKRLWDCVSMGAPKWANAAQSGPCHTLASIAAPDSLFTWCLLQHALCFMAQRTLQPALLQLASLACSSKHISTAADPRAVALLRHTPAHHNQHSHRPPHPPASCTHSTRSTPADPWHLSGAGRTDSCCPAPDSQAGLSTAATACRGDARPLKRASSIVARLRCSASAAVSPAKTGRGRYGDLHGAAGQQASVSQGHNSADGSPGCGRVHRHCCFPRHVKTALVSEAAQAMDIHVHPQATHHMAM
jgi:hypothetical protein